MNANSSLVGLPPEIQGKIAAYVSLDAPDLALDDDQAVFLSD